MFYERNSIFISESGDSYIREINGNGGNFMKKTFIVLLICIFTVGMLGGCSRAARNNARLKNAEKTSSSSTAGKNSQVDSELKSIGDPKNLSDSQLVDSALKGEQELKMDSLEDSIDDLGDLDSLINSKDPIGDIPSNIRVGN